MYKTITKQKNKKIKTHKKNINITKSECNAVNTVAIEFITHVWMTSFLDGVVVV